MNPLAGRDGRPLFYCALVAGLIVRVLILWQTSVLDTKIVDEQQYRQIASTLVAGDGFGWGPGQPTSIRPPLYPALLASVWTLTGSQNLQAVRGLQILLALATCAVVYQLGMSAFDVTTGRIAAAIYWLYPSLIFFDFLLLTETLFTFLFLLFIWLTVRLVQSGRGWTAVASGASLGLAALTRSVLWPLPLLLCPLLVLLIDTSVARRLALSTLVLIGYVLVVGPWAVRNTRLQEVTTIVDTMGGINLRMGNYEYTPDDRMWDAVALSGEKSWVFGITPDRPGETITEGRKEKWAQRKAIEYMRAHPLITLRRSFIKFADLWGLEREFIAGVQTGYFNPPQWFGILGSIAIVGGYILVAIIGGLGLWLAPPPDWRVHVLLVVPLLFIVAGHTIVFAHSRYHLPLMPILGLYGSHLLATRSWSFNLAPRPMWVGATATVAVLLAIWIRQVVLVDAARISTLLRHVV
jgi:4-amino-4-deoxy-L-arabinose transferase-like glycosyltransferase